MVEISSSTGGDSNPLLDFQATGGETLAFNNQSANSTNGGLVSFLQVREFIFVSEPNADLCDINGDGMCDVADIDAMLELLGEGMRTTEELSRLIISPFPDGFSTWFGDTDLNGEFDSSDLVAVFQAGEYEDGIPANSGWASGD